MKQNKPLAMAADQPLALSRSDHPWRVVSGFVDLFALRQGGQRGEGPRTFLLRVGTGGVFFPMPTALLDDEDMGIIAVGGLGAVIEPCLQPTPQDMDRWLLPLAGALQEQAPLHCDRIAAEGSLVLPRGEILAGSSQRPLWCRCPVGRLKLLGEEVAAPSEPALPQLVSPTLWYAAAEDCELFFLRSEDLAAEEAAAALAAFHGIAAGLVMQLVLRRRQQQAERLQRRAARSQAVLESGLAQLADAISPQQREVLPPDSSDPLLAVLRHLGARLQVEVREPTLEEQRFQRGSRLDMLLKTSCLRSRPVLLRGDWWTRENGPLLAWRKDSRQPLALLPEGSGYRCWDPLSGILSEVDDALAQTLAADGVMLYPRLPDRRIRLADFLPLGLGASRRDFRAFTLMALGAALLALLVPIGTGLLVDEIIPAAARGQLGILVGGLLAAALCTGAFELVKGMTLLRIEGRLDAGVQAALFDRLLRLPATFFKHYTAGDLSDRVLGVQAIRQLLSGTTVAALMGGLFSFVSLAMLFAYDKRLALLAVALTIFSLTVTALLTVLQLRHERALAQDRGKVEGLVLQLVAGVTKLKVAAAQDRAIGAWAGGYARQKRRFVAAQHLAALQAVFQSLFPPLATVAIFAGVAYLLKNHAGEAALKALTGSEGEVAPLGAGSFLAFQAAFGQFLGAMTHLVQSLTASLGVFPLYERAKPILEAQPENNSELPSPGLLDGAVEFAGVSFSYQPETPPVVQDLSFSLRPGEFVALVGPSGSGKSTVLRMLLGLEQPSQGEIFFDGKPVGRLNLDALRAQVAVVMQSGRILPGSVLSNIVGQEESALADAWEAARMVGLEEDIRAMPMGMHTVLMEGGGTLSGGQRQRLMIARALVRKPRILILDEATSALDNRTQAIVTESLRTLNITRLVVAHRLTTIESVDRVLVMERGRLVQSGTIEALRQSPGLFADLAQRQIF